MHLPASSRTSKLYHKPIHSSVSLMESKSPEKKPKNLPVFERNVVDGPRLCAFDTTTSHAAAPSTNFNQYTQPQSAAEWWDHGYQHLLSRISVKKTHEEDLFSCFIPKGPGIDSCEEDGNPYKRMNWQGKKVQCHNFVWAYHHPGIKKEGDISHLCGHGFCCRPSHLHMEPRIPNLARRNCPGYLVYEDYDDTVRYFDVCKHDPHCKTSTKVEFWQQVEDKPVDD
jgi:hypothetical protein